MNPAPMYQSDNASGLSDASRSVKSERGSGRLETIAYYILLAMSVIVPLSFWPSKYVTLDLVKTAIIAIGSLVAAILLAVAALKERKLDLPPKNIVWSSILIIASLVISSLASINIEKSILGQGFEIGTAGFIAALFVAAFVAFALVSRKSERAIMIYFGMAAAYIVLFLFHGLRLIFGTKFASLSILDTLTSSVIGSWYNMGIYSLLIALISTVGVMVLPLSIRMKIAYYALIVVSTLSAIWISASLFWQPAVLVVLGLLIFMSAQKSKQGTGIGSWLRKIALIPLIAFIVVAFFTWKGDSIIDKGSASNIYGGYTELALPWQMTLDVTAGAIKNYPLFGIGPNHFAQAYMAYKPAVINTTNAWNIEFPSGFGLIPTLVSAQGLVGSIIWLLFFVFFGLAASKALRKLPSDPTGRFLIISSLSSSIFLWLTLFVYVPSHSIVFLTFILTGIFFGSAISFGSITGSTWNPMLGSKSYKLMPAILAILIIVAAVWGIMYTKKTLALALFANGVKQLTVTQDPIAADRYFANAQSFDSSDVFWQARAEASLLKANKLASTVTQSTPASTSQAVLAEVVKATSEALTYARKAIAVDPTNYYNYVSEARVSETSAGFGIANAYENAVAAYSKAIGLNPFNPSLYLSLARLQASQNKLDDSLRTIGAALQVKSNYLDAIFLLSQVDAAKGNLPEAITAAQVATQINPQNPLLFFQLGLLQYNNKTYEASAQSFEKAVALQADYANAQYFLGLAYARLAKYPEAIKQFEALSATNPDNQELSLILTNLKAGKPIFADAKPPITPNPEKRSSLPIKEKKK